MSKAKLAVVGQRNGYGEKVSVHVDSDGIAVIQFNRPEAKNAFTFSMQTGFYNACVDLGEDPSVRVIIITGSGDSFCSGTDLKELDNTSNADRDGNKSRGDVPRRELPPDTARELKMWQGWWIATIPKPVICALNGMAVGMGAEYATLCDIRIMSKESRGVNWIFGKRGLVPDMGAGTWLLPKLIGYSNALRLLFTAEFHNAEQLKEIGFIHKIVEHDELLNEAKKEARRYLSQSPLALRLMKRQMYLGMERNPEEHLKMHRQLLQICFASQDHNEGVKSFVERRPPNFTGEMPSLAKEKYPITNSLME